MKSLSYPSLFICLLLTGCLNKNSPEYPEYVAKKYLEALKEKNWEEAKKYCDQSATQNLQCAVDMAEGKLDMKITEVKDIKCKVDNGTATCEFCCSEDPYFTNLKLMKTKETWNVIGVKETCPLYEDSLETGS